MSSSGGRASGTEIAIVGMAGRFPGARDVGELWRNLCAGVESIRRFTDDELLAAGIPAALLADPAYVKAKGVLEGAELFDSALFGLNPREAELIDPQQRVFLECAWAALEDAGRLGGNDQAVGVFAGTGLSHYLFHLAAQGGRGEADAPDRVIDTAQMVIGNDKDFLATRVAYKLDLRGPSVVVQSACSTSLVAVHLAAQSLLNGECDLALAGGVRVSVPQVAGYFAFEGGINSPDGHCRAYDVSAGGTVGGSGVGVVVLRRLEDALSDGDTIRAVIRGSALNNDGAFKIGYTAPSAEAQARVVAEALSVADVDPETIGYVEGHGTGTPLGDPIEIEGLTRAYAGAPARRCALGSVKTNLGHLDAAAGVTGLIKAVLAVEHGLVPPSLHCEEPHPALAASPFFVPGALVDWPRSEGPRRAGVSSFGLGGTNVHVVLEQAPARERENRQAPARPRTLQLSARTPAALQQASERLAAHLEAQPDLDLGDVAFTLQAGRRTFGVRRALACSSTAEAVEGLRAPDPMPAPGGLARDARTRVAFLFPGGGAQYAGMARGLHEHEPVFRREFERCAALFQAEGAGDVRAALLAQAGADLARPVTALPALFAVEHALAAMWSDWGVRPDAAIGHSLGEYAAACLAGVFTLEDACALVALRGRLFERLPPGGMLSVPMSEETLQTFLGADLSLAAVNAPESCVVTGPQEALDALVARLAEQDVECTQLHIGVAAHSPLVEPILDEFTAALERLRLAPPRLPFVSNLSGTWITPEEATSPDYWRRQLRHTVRFGQGLAQLIAEPGWALLEVGPGRTLTGIARAQVPVERRSTLIASLRHAQESDSDLHVLHTAAARLWACGVELDRARASGPGRRVPLPAYPFERTRHFVEARGTQAPEPESAPRAPADWFYLPSWRRRAPLAPAGAGLRGLGEEWLLFGDDGPLSRALAAQLERRGCRVTTLVCGGGFERHGTRRVSVDPAAPQDLALALAGLPGPLNAVHLWGCGRTLHSESLLASVLLAAQALAARQAGSRARLVTVLDGVADTSGLEPLEPHKARLLGLSRVLPQEQPGFDWLTIDVGPAGTTVNPEPLAERLLAEAQGGASGQLVALRGARRLQLEYVPARLDEGPAALREAGVYLITGGFGRVGAQLARRLATRQHARLVLLGRREPSPERLRLVQELEAAGAQVLALYGDVGDVARLREVVAEAEARFGALHGVFHTAAELTGATVLKPFLELTPEDLRGQLRAKQDGTLALRAALDGRELDFCLLFSSNASLLGGLGLGAYAAANAFLDAFANACAQQSLPWLSASWDGWATAALERRSTLAAYSLPPERGLDAVERVLAGLRSGHVAVSSGALGPRLALWLERRGIEPSAEPASETPRHERPELQTGYAAPTNDVERELAEIWQRLLGLARVGIHDSFFELGGTSLLAAQVMARVRKHFGVSVPLRALFEARNVAGLAERIAALVGRGAADGPALVPVPRDRRLPLSFGQQRLWFIDQYEDGAVAYNIPGAVRFSGALDVRALGRALDELLARHEALRTRFASEDGVPYQVIEPAAGVPLPPVDLHSLGREAALVETRRLAASLALQPFDLAAGPLLRAALVRLGPQEHVLAFALHHIVFDGWSLGVLLRELSALYEAFASGAPSPLAPLQLQYADFACWQRERLSGSALAEQLDYWRGKLQREPPPLALPFDRPRPAEQTFRGARATFALTPATTARVGALAADNQATPFMVLLAGFQALLGRYTGQADVTVGTPVAGRTHAELEGLIGYFLNTLVLRTDLSGQPAFRELVLRVRDVALGAYSHQDVPFEHLLEALEVQRDPSRPPLFHVMFVLQNPLGGEGSSGLGLDVSWLELDSPSSKFDLTMALSEAGPGLLGSVEYNPDLFDAATIERLVTHYQTLLEDALARPERPLAELRVLPAAEAAQLVAWNGTTHPRPEGALLHELIEAQVARTPEAVAVRFEGASLTFAALDARANGLARRLRELGVGPDGRVGVCMERSLDLIVALLAVLKAGAAYVPLDPEYPQQRLLAMVSDAAPALVLAERRFVELLPAGVSVLVPAELTAETGDSLGRLAEPNGTAYVIFTSGSTGRPKGVMVSHEAIVNRLLWMQAAYAVGPQDRVLQKTPFSFDVSVWELFLPLVSGARLVLARPGGQRDDLYLAETIAAEGVTLLHFVPSMLGAMLQAGGLAGCTGLRDVICSGEALPRELVDEFQRVQAARLHNLYGPTEAAVDVTFWECPRAAERRVVPIGRPIWNTSMHVLDAHLRPAPIGVAGELYIGGIGLARGYVNRPGLTAERFVPDPHWRVPGARLYRTGDLARVAPDGAIEYLGRADQQVKIRGNRIELGEIESALVEAGVREAAVVAREGRLGMRLVAYVVTGGPPADAPALRAALRARLPEYMLPAEIVTLERLPLSPNGKLDRRALPEPQGPAAPEQPPAAPLDGVEALICAVWAEVLRLPRVGPHDNFFALGGDSIVSIQAVARLRKAGVRVTPRQLFAQPTPAELAVVAGSAAAVQAEQGSVSGPVALTPIQRWFLEQRTPEPQHFNLSVLLEVPAGLSFAALRAALAELVRHHDALRLRVRATPSGFEQRCAPAETAELLERVDLGGQSQEAARAQIEAQAAALQQALDLEHGPLLRGALFDLGPERPARFFLTIHHLAVDGVSWRILLEDLQSAYAQAERGERVRLAAKTTSFQAWAERLQGLAVADALEPERAYWRAQLARPVDALPVEFPEGENTRASARALELELDAETSRALVHELPRLARASVEEVLLAALALAARRCHGVGGLVIDREGHGREPLFEDLDVSRTVGWFTSLHPLVLEASDDGLLTLRGVKQALRELPHNGVGFGLAGVERGAPAGLLFNYLGQLDGIAEGRSLFRPAEESVGRTQSALGLRTHLLDLTAGVRGGRLFTSWAYSEACQSRASVEVLAGALLDALRGLVAACRLSREAALAPSDFPLAGLSQAELQSLAREHPGLEDAYPPAPTQHGLLFHALLEPGTPAYCEQIAARLLGPLDPGRFERAWRDVCAALPVLRTGFAWDGLRAPLQVVRAGLQVPFELHDLTALEPEAQQRRLLELRLGDLARGFDLARPPLLRLALARLGPDEHALAFSYHHAILDGWSLPLLFERVFAAYAGTPVSEAPPYRSFVAWLRRQDLRRAEEHWRAELAGLAGPTPLLLPPPTDAQAEQEPCRARLPEDATDALKSLARAHGLTLSTLVQGAWALLLGARSGADDVLFGVTVSGRPAELAGIERMLGLFINTLPARVRIEAGRPLTAWLRELQACQAQSHEFEYAPLALVQSWSGAPREWPLFESLVVFENYPVESSLGERAPLAVALVDVRVHQRTHYGLTLIAAPGRELSLSLGFDAARFARQGVEGWLSALVALLARMAARPESALGELQALVRGSEPLAAVVPAAAVSRPPREVQQRPGVPLGATERAIAAAWSEVLGLQSIGRDDAFFDLGGNSLHLIQVRGRLADALGVTLPMRALFDYPSVATLAAFLHAEPDDRTDAPGANTSRADGRARLGQRLKRAGAAAGDRRDA